MNTLFIFNILLSSYYTSNQCQQIKTFDNLNITEYIRKPWYILAQQETSYLPLNSNYCVYANYSRTNKRVPFFNGNVLSVYNYANLNKVNGEILNSNNTTLCARIKNNSELSKLSVAPCFLPNLFAGDYWIIDVGPNSSHYEYAIVIGGQPNVKYSDGCTTKTDSINNSGLWLLSRIPLVNKEYLDSMKKTLINMNISIQLLNNVNQSNCKYKK